MLGQKQPRQTGERNTLIIVLCDNKPSISYGLQAGERNTSHQNFLGHKIGNLLPCKTSNTVHTKMMRSVVHHGPRQKQNKGTCLKVKHHCKTYTPSYGTNSKKPLKITRPQLSHTRANWISIHLQMPTSSPCLDDSNHGFPRWVKQTHRNQIKPARKRCGQPSGTVNCFFFFM